MIKAIDLGNLSNNYINKYDAEMTYLTHLDKINIFIGENNSGKSRLLRHIVKSKDVFPLCDLEIENNKKGFDDNKRYLLNNITNFNNESPQDLQINLPEHFFELDDSNFFCEVKDYIKMLGIEMDSLRQNKRSYFSSIQTYLSNMRDNLKIKNNNYTVKPLYENNIIYIPILRGAENFDTYYQLKQNEDLNSITMNEKQRIALNEYKLNAKHIYLNKVTRAYTINEKYIFTGENLFDDVKNKLLGEEASRNFIRDFEKFISDEFYDGEGFTIIPQINKGYLNVKIGNGEERALHNLGDGIKQLITIFYKLFEKRDQEAIFFIEEPEINLHPGYQRQFIQIIQNNEYFKKHQFFITTHSNHIIDNCLNYDNISIYKFINTDKNNKIFKVINTTNNDVDVLKLLGVYNSSIFMSNCTIWVEGISDKILISKYLKIYLEHNNEKEYKEDIHYSFVEYGGNNITHWSFIDNDDIATINASGITNKSFMICDNDNDKKITRKKILQSIFGTERYCELKVREIENTIKRSVLEKTLFQGKEVLIKKKYDEKEYMNKEIYMGSFIDKHYKLTKQYSNKSTGTIKNKLEFSKKVSSNINNIDDLSKHAIELCEKIFAFIKKSNYK